MYDALGRARRGDLHLLLAAVGVFDRPVGEHRGEEGDRLDDHVDLAAETAADRAADQPQLLERRCCRMSAVLSSVKNSACVLE